jgi:hypothetical protein
MSGSALDPDANFDLFSYTDLELFPYVEPENRCSTPCEREEWDVAEWTA